MTIKVDAVSAARRVKQATRRTPEQVEAFRHVAESGGSIKAAALAAGYSEATAIQGKRELPIALQEILAGVRKHIELGRTLNPQDQEAFVRGRALAAAEAGSDKGAQMLKLLGSDRRVNMFVPDTQVGVIVVGESKRLDALESGEAGLVLKAGEQDTAEKL